jgi:WD40 repeat protein/serine/threonine protein kinase
MIHSTRNAEQVGSADPDLAVLVDELTDRLQAGEAVDLEAFLGRHPEHAGPLRQLVSALEMIGELKGSAARAVAAPAAAGRDPRLEAGELGDFRIVREIGRGGMGVVYEAEQRSLGRRVALKVLPLAAALDSRQLQRFQLEAHAAACLHHTNIVPVHAVGCERGVPFYAMQYIEGRSLAQILGELRRLEGLDEVDDSPAHLADVPTSTLAAKLLSGKCSRFPAMAEPGPDAPSAGSPTPHHAGTASPRALRPLSGSGTASGSSTRGREYIRTVAQFGVQVAEALDHAHTRGILHRDIKPGNLLLDDQGQLWVTDFGLAQVRGNRDGLESAKPDLQSVNPCLTLTGDIVGTLRYMSPEQALGKRVVIDGRTDIYSLGLTLYELLTLRPAIDGQDRQEILRKIAQEEPVAPRKLNPAIPRGLETIVLKALAKEPGQRYTTADQMADELRRFAADRPILARRISTAERVWRWARRNKAIGSLLAALAVVLLGGLVGMTALWLRAENSAGTARNQTKIAGDRAELLERQLYINRVNLAHRERLADNVVSAERLLDLCPPARRGWEWYYCQRLSHLESLTLAMGSGAVASSEFLTKLASTPAGERIARASGGYFLMARGNSTGCATNLAFSPDGKRIARAIGGAMVRCWDAETGEELVTLRSQGDALLCVAFSPDGRWIATGGMGTVTLWNAETGRAARTIRGHDGPVFVVAFSPDGRRIASGMSTGIDATVKPEIKIWDALSGRELGVFQDDHWGDVSLAFSPDGREVACVNRWRPAIRLLDATTGREVRTLWAQVGKGSWGVAFDPDGSRIASGNTDGTVTLWDAGTGQTIRTYWGHASTAYSVAFSPDGSRIASAGEDGVIRLWDAETGDEVFSLRGHRGSVVGVAFSPDGNRIASASTDQTVKIWDASSPKPGIITRRRAVALVEPLFAELLMREDVLDSLRNNSALREPVRTQALILAEIHPVDATAVNNKSWLTARLPAASAAAYGVALRLAETACRHTPRNGVFLNTLGVAQYRVGKYKEALATLTQADELNSDAYRGSIPADLAFLAMAQYRLGQTEKARAALSRLRAAMQKPQWAKDQESQGFMREAEALELDLVFPADPFARTGRVDSSSTD